MLLIVWSKFVRFAHLTFIWKLFRAKNESTWPTFGFERIFSVFFFCFRKFFCFNCVQALKMSYHILPWNHFLCLHQFSVCEWHFFPFLDRIFMNNMWLFREKKGVLLLLLFLCDWNGFVWKKSSKLCHISIRQKGIVDDIFCCCFFCFSRRLCHFT